MTVVDLYCVDTGPVDAEREGYQPPLVLIHGLGRTSRDWDYVRPHFAEDRRVIAPDLRGYGRSPRGPDYTATSLAGDIWALLDGLGVGCFDLIGHSMGGAVALQMAVDHPDRLYRAVFADTLPNFALDTPIKEFAYWSRAALMLTLGPGQLTRTLARHAFPGEDRAAMRARIIEHSSGSRDRFVYLRTLHDLRDWNVENRIDRIQCPALVLAAEFDYFSQADTARFAAALPNGELHVVPEAHHDLPLEVPEIFAATVSRFFDAHPLDDDGNAVA